MASNSGPLDLAGLSSNVISDFGPILTLFGEQVAKQFMSQSMGWIDNIIFSMAPLGIITAIVGAIRVGGPGWLKAIVGRARENRAMAEIELMSSTSHEVCEMWDGQNIVRIMGAPEIRELVYISNHDAGTVVEELTPAEMGNVSEERRLTERGNVPEEHTPAERDNVPEEHTPAERDNVPEEHRPAERDNVPEDHRPAEGGNVPEDHSPAGGGSVPEDHSPAEGGNIPEDHSPAEGGNVPEEQTFSLYTLESKDPQKILQITPGSPIERWLSWGPVDEVPDPESPKLEIRDNNHPKSAPNISLNLHSHAPDWELYLVAVIGTGLQTAVLVYAYYSVYSSGLKLKLNASSPIWAWYFTLIGTLSVVAGMLGCCYIIEKSTNEERYRVEGGEGHILWLQKGETVNDQVFYSYAIFAKNQRSILMTSRRNDKLANPDNFFFGSIATAAALFSLVGFIVQFMGLRGMHWSVSVAQVLATVIMTILRAVVRRGLSESPYSQQLPPEHEMDWLAVRFAEGDDRLRLRKGPEHIPKRNFWKRMRGTSTPYSETPTDKFWEQGCFNWSIITGARNSGYEPLEPITLGNRAQGVVNVRKRLGYLTQWPGAYSDKATSVATAIEHVMNIPELFHNQEVFRWSMAVDVGQSVPETIKFKVENISGKWKADLAEIEAALSLWIFSVHKDGEGTLMGGEEGTPMGDGGDAWLRSGKASTQQGIRLLGESGPLSRRDMKWWIGDGLKKVLEVDLSKPGTYAPDGRVTIKSGDCRVVGFGGGKLLDGDYKTRPLSETPIEVVLVKKMDNESSLPNPVSVAPLDPEIPIDNDLAIEVDKPKFCLATVSEAPLDLLFAQEMFSAFMWAFAKSPNVSRISGQTTVKPQSEQGSNSNTGWQSFTLQNTTLSNLVQSIERIGLGGLDEIYMSILPPLSAYGRLPDAGAVVDYIHQQTKKYQLSGHWEKAWEMYLWMFRAFSHGIPDVSHTPGHHTPGSSTITSGLHVPNESKKEKQENTPDSDPTASTKVTAALMEFLRSLSTEVERCKKQRFHQAVRTSEPLQEVLHDCAQILRSVGDRRVFDNLAWLYERQDGGVDWESVVGVGEFPYHDNIIENPIAFGLTTEHQRILLNRERPLDYGETSNDVNKKDVLGWTPLHYAANRGNKSLIEELVAAGADWRSNDIREWTPLHYAAANATLELDWELLKEKIDVNTQGRDGLSPLHCAATSGNAKMATLLIESGANMQIYGNSRETPLHLAAYHGFPELVSLMLRYGANPRAADDYGRTPLHLAAMQGSTDVVEIVMKVIGKMIDAKERDGLTPMQMAALRGHVKVVQVLLERGADVNAQGGQYGNALQAAASGGRGEIVKVLLDHGADVNVQGGRYGDALRAAASRGHVEIVQKLLECKADANAQGGWYGNVLQATALRGRDEIVQLLLEHGVNVNAQGGRLGNALQAAARGGHDRIVKVLLEKGADVNAQGGRLGNALQAAARGGHGGIVKVLLEKEADVNAQGGKYGHALQAAAFGGYGEIVQVLLDGGADVNAQCGGDTSRAAAVGKLGGIVQKFLERGADANTQGGWYANALQAAALRGHAKIVNVLLEKGAEVNKQGGEYGNALQAAALKGYGEIVQELLEKKADVNAQGGKYGNALQAAASGGHGGVVKVLLEKRADVNVQGGKYGNALQAAALGGHHEIVRMLREHGVS